MSQDQICEHNEYLNNDDDVIAFSADSMCKLAIFKQKIQNFLSNEIPNKLVEFLEHQGIKYMKINQSITDSKGRTHTNIANHNWLKDGKECEILQVGSNGWKKGKIRLKVSLEFIPDEPKIKEIESPLDDIRQSIN